MSSYFMAGQPPTRVIADTAVRGSGPVETNWPTPTSACWRELAGARSIHLGTLEAAGFLRLLPDDAIATGTAVVPAIVAGADLTVFPVGLFSMYLNRPGLPDIWTPAGPPLRWSTT